MTQLYPRNPILIVDDEPMILELTRSILETHGINNVITEEDSTRAVHHLTQNNLELAIFDLKMPRLGGHQLLERFKAEAPEVPIIIATTNSEIDIAVQCMSDGACDFMVKPVKHQRLFAGIQKAMRQRELYRENMALKDQLLQKDAGVPKACSHIVTRDPKILSIFRYLQAVSKSTQAVLISGETGVGKELFVQALFKLSESKGKLITSNIAGLDDHMLSDTLFGHRKGAFTGAEKSRQGLVESASGGVLFLDEIGDMAPVSQAKLLRFIEQNEYYPLGSDSPAYANTRVVFATNRELDQSHDNQSFRKDLYYRISTHHVRIPPLRERRDDLPLLVSHFLQAAAKDLNRKPPTVPQELQVLLSNYHFPGNIRELRNMIFEAMSLHQGGILSLSAFKEHISRNRGATEISNPDSMSQGFFKAVEPLPTIQEATESLVEEALERSGGNQSVASRFLGISQQALSKRVKRTRLG